MGRPRRLRTRGAVGCLGTAQRQDTGRRLLPTKGLGVVGRRAQAFGARLASHVGRRRALARRTRQLPRHSHACVARRPNQGVQVDHPHGQPRPCAPRTSGDQGHRHRRFGVLGPRRLVCHFPRSTRQAPGTTRRRPEALGGRRASTLPSHEDHEAARGAELQECDQGQRRRNPLGGSDSARRVVKLEEVTVDDLFFPFSDEVHFGERVGLIGPNGTGKTHLLNALNGHSSGLVGTITFGPRTSVGMFTQVNDRPEFAGRTCIDIVRDKLIDEERSMRALARYGLRNQARQEFQTLSGGQKARLEILTLELDGHNVLLLDEPTDNLDIESSEALETALDGFEGTVIAVSHDRTFLAKFDRFIMVTDEGGVFGLPDFDVAMKGLADPEKLPTVRLAKPLTS
ncbi:MAG: ABC transporter ATP-binding protein [Actinobacteria bacterium]|nr:ABC transporter ATP-binding protein [Actinomycetota bacterium]